MSETVQLPPEAPAATPPATPAKPLGQAAVDARKEQQEAAIKKAAEANAKIQARANVLEGYVGKSYRRKDGTSPNQIHTIKAYGGIANVVIGMDDNDRAITAPAHIFNVESKSPGQYWTPIASRFLDEFEEVQPEPEIANEIL